MYIYRGAEAIEGNYRGNGEEVRSFGDIDRLRGEGVFTTNTP